PAAEPAGPATEPGSPTGEPDAHDTPDVPGAQQTELPVEKPKRRPTRRRATAKVASAESATAEPATAEPATAGASADASEQPASGAPAVEAAQQPAAPEAEETPQPAETLEAEQATEPEETAEPDTATEPETAAEPEQTAEAEQAAEQPEADTTTTRGGAASLAPQLSHVDTAPKREPATPPVAAFNPFAVFVAPEDVAVAAPATSAKPADEERATADEDTERDAREADLDSDDDAEGGSRRRRRGRRGRGKRAGEDDDQSAETDARDQGNDEQAVGETDQAPDKQQTEQNKPKGKGGGEQEATQNGRQDDESEDEESGSRRRRRRRRRGGDSESADDSSQKSSSADKVKSVSGSVRLEAKRQRRKEGRDHGRRRAPILTEAEFLARRESVTRSMVVRQQGERTQIAVLEDDVLVEHYVTLASEQSFAGGVYYGRVQNVLPSMEAAFIDIGKRRNAVLYAGEVDWDAAGLAGKQRNIEQALKSGDKVLVQVTKDPIGHKGARLTSQISLPGRYLVYVPGGSMTGISRKLPEGERQRLKEILRRIVPDEAGVIIRTAAEGASEEELTRDVNRLKAQWDVIQEKVADSKTKAPSVLYEEPDLAIRVVRDLFNEDFASMVIAGDDAWDTISGYMQHVAPDLVERVSKYDGSGDVFAEHRIDEQLTKALDRKVWLPSGGSLVIDHTEAMTVIDVNTGKFTGSGGNLEQTVTKNNLEAAEEIVRQLRLRDVGGIVVIDFIDMLLESNRELVLRRLTECLGRDRTKHQVAEVTSLGLVQMTRKRVGQGLLDAFSEPCPHCDGRGLIVHAEPVEKKTASTGSEPQPRRGRGKRGAAERTPEPLDSEPKRDSTTQLSAIAAATKKGEDQPTAQDIAQAATPSPQPEPNAEPTTPASTSADTPAQEVVETPAAAGALGTPLAPEPAAPDAAEPGR
ncbi:Rne/Rng family ribonuclease, partial [Cumulibacter manganitolerans]|uniref:Rne/Rng family ribonuclease n=1 Tax=Cumulibacter manganitolerans TaxID=1884992 RepID=UPI002B1FCBEE